MKFIILGKYTKQGTDGWLDNGTQGEAEQHPCEKEQVEIEESNLFRQK